MVGRRSRIISLLSVRYYYLSRFIFLVSFCCCYSCLQQQQVYSFQLYPKIMPIQPPQSQWNTRIIATTGTFKTTGFLPPTRPSMRLYSSPPSEDQQQDIKTTSSSGNNIGKTTKTTLTIYKDDCFGFITFLAGIGMKDIIFLFIFVILSLLADVATRLGFLPPDPKRPTIIDRKIPGIVAFITLCLTPIITTMFVEGGSGSNNNNIIPEPESYARSVQLVVCSFSMITSFFDIRWRDRFDYPEEY